MRRPTLLCFVLVCISMKCVFGQGGEIVDVCSMPAEIGSCKGHLTRYFYNPETTHCEEFIYGGCGGNQNNFDSIFECRKTCGQTMPQDTIGVGVPVM